MTDKYQHILLAIDFSEQSELIAAKAKELSRLYRAKLSIVHVLDNIAMPDTAYDTVIPLDQDSHDEALEAEKTNSSTSPTAWTSTGTAAGWCGACQNRKSSRLPMSSRRI